jgi:chromosome segregation ATPase
LFYKQKRASNLLILHLELECESEHHGMLETELTPHSVKSPTYPSNGQGGQRPTLGTARVGSSGAAANASTPGATYPLSGAGRTSTIDMNSIRVALGSITQDNVDVSKRITTVEKECALANQRMQSLEGKHIETAEQVASLEKENMEMNERMESMGNRVNELEGRMDGLISKVDEYADVEDLGDEVRRVEARLAHVETQINKSTTTSQNLLEMGETFRKQLNHLKKISEGQESLYQTLVRSVEDLRVYMMERIDGIDDIVGHKLDLENEIHRVRCDLDETASADELEMLLRNGKSKIILLNLLQDATYKIESSLSALDVSLDSVNSKPKKAIENFYGRYFKTLREEIEDHFERSEEIFEDFSDIVSELSEDSKTGHVPVTPPPTYRSNYTNNIAQD